MHNFDYEILDLGLVYYKNVLDNTDEIIKNIEDLDSQYTASPHIHSQTIVTPWFEWKNEGSVDQEHFCWQKMIPQVDHIGLDDPFREQQIDISKKLFGAIDNTLEHYSTQIYPFAKNNIKSREQNMHLLKYNTAGFLPAHQDQGVSTRVLSVLLYLNDDYEGGEITFRQSNVKFKPSKGSIVFFPSNFLYIHEVQPVTKGPRYAVPNWFHNVPFNQQRNSTGEE